MLGRVLEIPYLSKQHSKIKAAIRERFTLSALTMSKRHDAWKQADDLYRCYVPESTDDAQRRKQKAAGKQVYTDLVIPSSYAILLSSHTYWSSVFLSRTPVFQFAGRHGESEQQVQALEALIDYQRLVGGMVVPLYIWLLDAGRYGLGVIGNYWAEESTHTTQIVEVDVPREFMGISIPGTSQKKSMRQIQETPGYKGNRIYNVRPHDFYPDPRVSIVNFQRGEFCGRTTAMSWNEILKRRFDSSTGRGDYFNLDALERVMARGSGLSWNGDQGQISLNSTDMLPETNTTYNTFEGDRGRGFPAIKEMTIELAPKDWELGSSTYPEKWVFTLANDEVIIGARPLGEAHDKFPFFIQTYEIEGYQVLPRGMLEVTRPLNDTMGWLLNTHFYNVRKVMNDMLIVDPSRIEMKDLTDGGPGKLIRLKPSMYGQDVRTAITQLPVTDITARNFSDMQFVWDLMQRVTGCTDNTMGMVNAGGRKTATEIRTSSSFGINRMKTFAEYNSALGWEPLAQVLVQSTQQHYDTAQYYKVAGDLLRGTKFLEVSPEAILGFYDFVPVDGTLPIDRFAQASLWKEILMGMAKMPQLAMQFDMGGIFSWMAQLAGLKNINQFKIQVQPDAQVEEQARAGNLVLPGTSAGIGGGATSAGQSGLQDLISKMGGGNGQ